MKAIPISLFLLVLACVPVRASAASPHHHAVRTPRWKSCTVHLTWDYSGVSYARCHRYHIVHAPGRVIGSWTATRYVSPHIRRWLRYPRFATPQTVPVQPEPSGATYTAAWLVTWYGPTGAPMANGIMPSIGWAACGWDVPLGTRVAVSGLGVYTCGDRIGYDPYQHIDLFDVPAAGAGYRTVTVTLP